MHDEVVGVGYACRSLHLLLSRGLVAECDIIENGIIEKYRLLIHISHKGAEIFHTQILHIDTVNEYLAAFHIPEPRYKIHKCRLAGTRLPHDSHCLAGIDLKVDMRQHIAFAVIAETDIAERHRTLASVFRQISWSSRILNRIDSTENLVDALHCRHTFLYGI